ncbi:hypothetical protein CEXT_626041 [Caerostris extrusa]|uniref:Uncharacterized protein n=1 Tax=Caerostris extrusa TaxID=172846 RepID=A0AAV4XWU2_CAEEX|nr:hypothetical protein CEXT_626041 [Caerostris extrusa]
MERSPDQLCGARTFTPLSRNISVGFRVRVGRGVHNSTLFNTCGPQGPMIRRRKQRASSRRALALSSSPYAPQILVL